jgi:murein L,D-transpeptidase YcbB/YkuD
VGECLNKIKMFEEIVQHFLSKICTSDEALSDKRCSNPDLLFPPFKEKIDSVIKEYLCDNKTIPEFFETYRSNKRQVDMHASGASDIPTNGMHHFGIAVDLVGKTEKGNWNWDVLDYGLIRSTAKKLGLSLLIKEDCHIQLIPIAKQTMLRRAIFQGVKDFQKEHGLKSDGIVGLKTIAALKIAYTPKPEIE